MSYYYGEKMSSKLNEKERDFLRKLITRGVNEVVVRTLEVVSRFAQYRLRELIARGIGIDYSMGIEYERDEVVFKIRVRVPEWWVEEQIEKRSGFVKMLRRLQYNIRRAEQYMYQWPHMTDRDLIEEALVILAQEATEERARREEEMEGMRIDVRSEDVDEGVYSGEKESMVMETESYKKGMRKRVQIEIEGLEPRE